MAAVMTLVLAALALALLPPGTAAAAPGDILVVDPGPPGGPQVVRVDPATGARTLVSANGAPAGGPDMRRPLGIAVAPGGDILVADSQAFAGGGVIRIDPATGARTAVSANGAPAGGPDFASPPGLALESDGYIVATDSGGFKGGVGGVIRVDPDLGERTVVSGPGMPSGAPNFVSPFGIAVEADGDLVVVDQAAFNPEAGIIRVDPLSGARSVVSTVGNPNRGPGFVEPFGIAVESDGNLLVADPALPGTGGGIIRVNATSGVRSLVSESGQRGGGAAFVDPVGLALEADGDILVADGGTDIAYDGRVLRVDPASGARAVVSANGAPAGGPQLAMPVALAVVPSCPAGRRDRDRDGTPDACDQDDDNDRLPDRAERRLGTSSSDLDSDDDGLADGREDRDHDGRKDRRETSPRRFDTDRDGLSDGLELGVRVRVPDPRGPVRGSGRRFRRDLGPHTRTNPLRADTDGGGVPDGAEDRNHNGRVDRGEHDPARAGG